MKRKHLFSSTLKRFDFLQKIDRSAIASLEKKGFVPGILQIVAFIHKKET
ncbi:hypothetical protein L8106_24740 [Lyngbya sp. PCC 8106]|nr:hypothetical protein L8106_24740 [Lyngbya sp. PCC 8106]